MWYYYPSFRIAFQDWKSAQFAELERERGRARERERCIIYKFSKYFKKYFKGLRAKMNLHQIRHFPTFNSVIHISIYCHLLLYLFLPRDSPRKVCCKCYNWLLSDLLDSFIMLSTSVHLERHRFYSRDSQYDRTFISRAYRNIKLLRNTLISNDVHKSLVLNEFLRKQLR